MSALAFFLRVRTHVPTPTAAVVTEHAHTLLACGARGAARGGLAKAGTRNSGQQGG
jgi:hypothetical protein